MVIETLQRTPDPEEGGSRQVDRGLKEIEAYLGAVAGKFELGIPTVARDRSRTARNGGAVVYLANEQGVFSLN